MSRWILDFQIGGDAMNNLLRPAFMLLLVMTVITGAIYPAVVTGIAQLLFAHQANGSIVERDGKLLGSELIGQAFSDPKYFWSRPSATAPFADNSASSNASNLGPTNPALTDAVKQRIDALRAADPADAAPVPVDLVTASGSGLDPHISPAAAKYQLTRVARARGIGEDELAKFVRQATEGRTFGILGEPRVNVLKLNLLLDGRW
jgi:potassium-transporting ATPase KdpC subunit